MAAIATSANDIVPQRSSAMHHAAGAAGTTVRATPAGHWPPCRRSKYSTVETRGYGTTPGTWHVWPGLAMWTRMGATPATLTMSGWTTPSVIPAATPASIALTPALRTRAAASEASAWPAATAHERPMAWTVWVGVWAGAERWADAESSDIVGRSYNGPWPSVRWSAWTSVTFGSSPERAYVNAAYVRAVQAAGGAPVLL